jgi:hypothetical protein
VAHVIRAETTTRAERDPAWAPAPQARGEGNLAIGGFRVPDRVVCEIAAAKKRERVRPRVSRHRLRRLTSSSDTSFRHARCARHRRARCARQLRLPACRAQSGTLVVAAQMLVGERKDVTRCAADNLATLDPAESRSVVCPARTSRGFCVFVDGEVSASLFRAAIARPASGELRDQLNGRAPPCVRGAARMSSLPLERPAARAGYQVAPLLLLPSQSEESDARCAMSMEKRVAEHSATPDWPNERAKAVARLLVSGHSGGPGNVSAQSTTRGMASFSRRCTWRAPPRRRCRCSSPRGPFRAGPSGPRQR